MAVDMDTLEAEDPETSTTVTDSPQQTHEHRRQESHPWSEAVLHLLHNHTRLRALSMPKWGEYEPFSQARAQKELISTIRQRAASAKAIATEAPKSYGSSVLRVACDPECVATLLRVLPSGKEALEVPLAVLESLSSSPSLPSSSSSFYFWTKTCVALGAKYLDAEKRNELLFMEGPQPPYHRYQKLLNKIAWALSHAAEFYLTEDQSSERRAVAELETFNFVDNRKILPPHPSHPSGRLTPASAMHCLACCCRLQCVEAWWKMTEEAGLKLSDEIACRIHEHACRARDHASEMSRLLYGSKHVNELRVLAGHTAASAGFQMRELKAVPYFLETIEKMISRVSLSSKEFSKEKSE